MLPDNTYSTIPIPGLWTVPDDRVTTPIVDYERGGIALNNTSQGLRAKNWKAWLDDQKVMVQGEGDAFSTQLFEENQITELALAFDQNMRWSIGYVAAGILKLRWYDSNVNAYVISTFAEARNPKMALDDKRPLADQTSDIIFAYIRGNSLYYRQQRDRFTIERLLKDELFPGTKLKNIGLNKNLRMQFELV